MEAVLLCFCTLGVIQYWNEVQATSAQYYSAEDTTRASQLSDEIIRMMDEITSVKHLSSETELSLRLGDIDKFVHSQLRTMTSAITEARSMNDTLDDNFGELRESLTNILGLIDTLGYIFSRTMHIGESKSTTIGDIAMVINRPDAEQKQLTKSLTSPFSKSNIQIPGTMTLSSVTEDTDTIVFYTIRKPQGFLETNENETIVSDIMSASIFTKQTHIVATAIRALYDPVIITFEKTTPTSRNHIDNNSCKFMEFARGEFAGWSNKGCFLGLERPDIFECHCNHLTAFAVLKSEMSDQQTLNFVTWFGCIVTSIFCMMTAMAIIGYRILNSGRSYMRMSFLVMLGSSEVVFLAGVRYTEMPAVCTMIALYLQYSVLGSFTWLLSYVLFLGNEVTGVVPNALKVVHYSFIGWMTPLLVALITLIWRYDSYMNKVYCWIAEENYLGASYMGPIVFVAFLTLCLLLYVIRTYYKVTRKCKIRAHMLEVAGGGIRSCCLLLPFLTATWVLAHFVIVKQTLVLQILFSVCNTVLGILVFLFMFLFNEEIRRSRRKNSKRSSPCSCCDIKSRYRRIRNPDADVTDTSPTGKSRIKPVISIEDTADPRDARSTSPVPPFSMDKMPKVTTSHRVPILATPEDLTSEEAESESNV